MTCSRKTAAGLSETHNEQSLKGAQSIQRAALLLRAIAGHNRTGLRLVDLVDISGLEVPTAHRILKALVAENLIKQNLANRRYFLGALMFEAGLAAIHEFSLRDVCLESMERIADKTGDTVFLNMRRDHEAVCLERKVGEFPIKVFSLNVGERRPLGVGAGGMAILCNLRESEIQQIIQKVSGLLPRYGNLNERMLMSLVRRSQERGYVLHKRSIFGLGGGKAVGVPIRNSSGDPFASLSITAITSRMSTARCVKLVGLLRREAAAIERTISHRELARPPSQKRRYSYS